MDPLTNGGRLLVGLAVAVLLGGCAGGASPSPTRVSSAPASLGPEAITTPAPTPAATAAPSPTPGVVVTTDVAYESANPALIPGELDVYAPAEAGAWPVVVMFHGAPGSTPKADRSGMSQYARRLADQGYVVFNASWGHEPGGASDRPSYDYLLATQSQAACAVEFARAHAADYGGDPGTMIAYGHSGGAHAAAMAAFIRREPGAGCLGGTSLGAIDALVTWEGNWLLSVNAPDWDGALAADPKVMDAVTPWSSLAAHRDQKVVMLVSEDPDLSLRAEAVLPESMIERPVGDPWADDSWLAVRDPSGDLRRQLEANGAFADGTIGFADEQQLLYSVLKAQGNPVTLDVMPESSHAWLCGAGWDVYLAAFAKAAAP
jgi:dienelactone hydrolase